MNDKTPIICPKCGDIMGWNAQYGRPCDKCGYNILKKDYSRKCSRCEKFIPKNAKICEHCGYSFVKNSYTHKCQICDKFITNYDEYCDDCTDKMANFNKIKTSIEKLANLAKDGLINDIKLHKKSVEIVFNNLGETLSTREIELYLISFKEMIDKQQISEVLYGKISDIILDKNILIRDGDQSLDKRIDSIKTSRDIISPSGNFVEDKTTTVYVSKSSDGVNRSLPIKSKHVNWPLRIVLLFILFLLLILANFGFVEINKFISHVSFAKILSGADVKNEALLSGVTVGLIVATMFFIFSGMASFIWRKTVQIDESFKYPDGAIKSPIKKYILNATVITAVAAILVFVICYFIPYESISMK